MRIAHQSVYHASIVITAALLLGRALGLLREILIARLYGTTSLLDVYRAAFVIPDLLAQVLVTGTVSAALIPMYVEIRHQRGEQKANQIASGVLNGGLALLGVIAVFLVAVAPHFSEILAPGFTPSQHVMLSKLLRILVWYPPIAFCAIVLGAILNAHHHFIAPALAPAVDNLVVILGLVWLVTAGGLPVLAVVVLCSTFVYFLTLLPGFKAIGLNFYTPFVSPFSHDVLGVILRMLPRVGTVILMQFTVFVTVNLASRLVPGSIAALGYGLLTVRLFWSLIAVPLATASFPRLSELYSKGEVIAFQTQCERILAATVFFLIPAAALLLALRVPVVSLLFERGRFNVESTRITAHIVAMYVFGIVGLGVEEVVLRFFYVLKDTFTPLIVVVPTSMMQILLSLLWWDNLGAPGIALAASAAYVSRAVILTVVLFAKLHTSRYRALIFALLTSFLAGMVIAVLGSLGWHLAEILGAMGSWIGKTLAVAAISSLLLVLYCYVHVVMKHRIAKDILLRLFQPDGAFSLVGKLKA